MDTKSRLLYAFSEEWLEGDVRVLSFSGELDLTAVSDLHERLNDLIDSGAPRMMLDLRSVSFIDSTAIAVVMRAAKRLRDRHRRLPIVCEHPHVLKVFGIVALDRMCPIYSSREEVYGSEPERPQLRFGHAPV